MRGCTSRPISAYALRRWFVDPDSLAAIAAWTEAGPDAGDFADLRDAAGSLAGISGLIARGLGFGSTPLALTVLIDGALAELELTAPAMDRAAISVARGRQPSFSPTPESWSAAFGSVPDLVPDAVPLPVLAAAPGPGPDGAPEDDPQASLSFAALNRVLASMTPDIGTDLSAEPGRNPGALLAQRLEAADGSWWTPACLLLRDWYLAELGRGIKAPSVQRYHHAVALRFSAVAGGFDPQHAEAGELADLYAAVIDSDIRSERERGYLRRVLRRVHDWAEACGRVSGEAQQGPRKRGALRVPGEACAIAAGQGLRQRTGTGRAPCCPCGAGCYFGRMTRAALPENFAPLSALPDALVEAMGRWVRQQPGDAEGWSFRVGRHVGRKGGRGRVILQATDAQGRDIAIKAHQSRLRNIGEYRALAAMAAAVPDTVRPIHLDARGRFMAVEWIDGPRLAEIIGGSAREELLVRAGNWLGRLHRSGGRPGPARTAGQPHRETAGRAEGPADRTGPWRAPSWLPLSADRTCSAGSSGTARRPPPAPAGARRGYSPAARPASAWATAASRRARRAGCGRWPHPAHP